MFGFCIYTSPFFNYSTIITEISNTFSILPKPIVILGDFNAQHTSWGSSKSNQWGHEILDLLDIQNLCILNTGIPTRRSAPHEGYSVPDLSISTPNLASSLQWSVLTSSYGSDHFPIQVSLPPNLIKQSNNYKSTTVKYNTNNADWDLFQREIERKLNSLPKICTGGDSICSEAFTSAVSEVASKVLSLKHPHKQFMPSPPWWDADCTKAIKNRKSAEKMYSRCTTNENFKLLSDSISYARALFRKKKTGELEEILLIHIAKGPLFRCLA